MKKMRKTPLERFKLHFEYLPSEEPIMEAVRQYRRQATLKIKREHREIFSWVLTLPGMITKLIAQIRARGKHDRAS